MKSPQHAESAVDTDVSKQIIPTLISNACVYRALSKHGYRTAFQPKKWQHSFCFVLIFFLFFWQSLSSEVILENSKLPEGVTLAYTSRCKNGVVSEGENGRKCSNISIGDEVSGG